MRPEQTQSQTAIEESDEASAALLYAHIKRPEWGLAIRLSSKDSRTRYQFQDGQLRTFGRGTDHFFEPVDQSLDVVLPIVDELEARVERVLSRRDRERSSVVRTEVSFDEQMALFSALHPDGFAGDDYTHTFRTPAPGKKASKGHWEAAVSRARELLAQERLDRLLEAGDHAAVHQSVCEVLASTTWVTPTARRHLETMHAWGHAELAVSLRDVLYGDGPYAHRFTRLVAALDPGRGKAPSWALATALPALVHPETHGCVQPNVFREQARWMAPRLRYEKVPTAGLYERFRAMAGECLDRLREAGHAPRDLLDVAAFIHMTLRPTAREMISRARARANAEHVELGAALAEAA